MTDRRQRVIFIGLQGDFPTPANEMLLRITLPEEKESAWTSITQRVLSAGFISHAKLESIIGRLSLTQTSVFGGIGRGAMAPLYAKLLADPYRPF